jgi:hypothetical protein
MIKATNIESGFSAVELLITLFVAAAFLATGYQLYSVIVKDGSEARYEAKASNIGYDNLRKYSPKATIPCTNIPNPLPTATIPANSGLPTPNSITVTIDCPAGLGTTSTSRVNVSVKYGSPQREVVHAIFVSP